MRGKLGLIAAGAIALAVPAAAAEQLKWLRASSPDGAFSVETPCTAEEVERGKQLPPDFVGGVPLPAASRVVCMKGGILVVAGLVEEEAWPKEGPSLFEQLSTAAKSDPTLEGTPTLTAIDGHRAFLNRQTTKELVAQTGLVEISRTKILFAIAGGAKGMTAMQPNDQAAMVDHFYGSIEMAGK